MALSRRAWLLGVTGAIATGSVAANRYAGDGRVLVGGLATESAARVGQRYLSEHPAEKDGAALVRALGLEGGDGRSDEAQEHVRALVREDFRTGQVIEIEGWWIAKSEARLCAVAWLLESGELEDV